MAIVTSSVISKGLDVDILEFPLNLEYLEAEFFLWASLGYGLDKNFAEIMDKAFCKPLRPPFDPYANSLNFLLASYLIPYVGLTGYVGSNSHLSGSYSKRLVAGLLGVESGQDAVIRTMLYERAKENVWPYDITVAEFTEKISELRNKLGGKGVKDEGIIVPPVMGPCGKMSGNVLAGDGNSVAYARTPREILNIVYGKGSPHVPGGFYPNGASGRIARSYLKGRHLFD
ncbi:hypothetical protein QJS04_geneDACA021500 [Acorus gramineus]|uniref:Desiccation-related protein PCC13-62 n=1 Tax=Acorus gramineus TaxID=55184 RepID=A0AAV9A4Z0_ACOGR|nr:hypothetical protein QJS04_geneDACA021500 [Acorus gramineus]